MFQSSTYRGSNFKFWTRISTYRNLNFDFQTLGFIAQLTITWTPTFLAVGSSVQLAVTWVDSGVVDLAWLLNRWVLDLRGCWIAGFQPAGLFSCGRKIFIDFDVRCTVLLQERKQKLSVVKILKWGRKFESTRTQNGLSFWWNFIRVYAILCLSVCLSALRLCSECSEGARGLWGFCLTARVM